jgi:hypothetical protein
MIYSDADKQSYVGLGGEMIKKFQKVVAKMMEI